MTSWVCQCLKLIYIYLSLSSLLIFLISHVILLDHYSVLADQEPLYQFYAAAAARIASDFSSDDYEEVMYYITDHSEYSNAFDTV